jgi:tRNA nucleotidyltransferase/poly(A) polymerase
MSTAAPSVAGAAWFREPAVAQVFALFASAGEEARVVGGAVRNTLLDAPVHDVDFATTATPDRIVALAAAAGIKTVPTGFDHGTLTLVIDGHAYEVTTLRQDIATDGRHATVQFGRDWSTDALRRDFTVNALYADSSGAIHDPVGGLPDIAARRIRFIGDADQRIAEDRLRILRFFRFHAQYGQGAIDPVGLSASIRARDALRDLSAERVGQEMRKLVVAPGAVDVVTLMQESGILPVVLGGIAYLAQFGRMVRASAGPKWRVTPATRLAALGCRIPEDALRLTERLRLSNAERDRMLATLAAAAAFAPFPDDDRAKRRLLYRLGEEDFRDGVFHGFAWNREPAGEIWKDAYHFPERWTAPKFPLGGRDIGDSARGPAVGALLRDLESWWIAQDFAPDEAALRSRLQQMIAAQQ